MGSLGILSKICFYIWGDDAFRDGMGLRRTGKGVCVRQESRVCHQDLYRSLGMGVKCEERHSSWLLQNWGGD